MTTFCDYSPCIKEYHTFIDACEEEGNNLPSIVVDTYLDFCLNNLPSSEQGRMIAIRLLKSAIKKYPYLFQPHFDKYREQLKEILFPYSLLLKFNEKTTLNGFKECLMSIQCQTLNEDTYFDVTQLQIIVWGNIPTEVLKYDYSMEYPLIDDNILFLTSTDFDEVCGFNIPTDKTGYISASLILKNNVELYRYFIKGE